ncbi:signal peptidase I [Enterococcus raffinosus]|uniref:signal peptidase I n=1 Tax=Enterococcus raffinosus TaxID=71452 RepID=UPI000763BE00|nr:signal peptidase I [Enterococcus raffinosus]OJG89388.1 signal peptidase I [Enterococcus raffinosus]
MKKAQEVKAKPKKRNRTSSDFLKQELFSLVVKLAILLTLAYFVVHFVYGITRYPDDSMVPAVKSGDVALYYRLNKNYVASDVVALEYENDLQLRRVVAIEGDTVDITEEGLEINNHLQAEHQIYEETLPYTEGIDYPVKIGTGEVFVLGDKREAAIDSRVYGPIKTKDTLGKVITILRRRSI